MILPVRGIQACNTAAHTRHPCVPTRALKCSAIGSRNRTARGISRRLHPRAKPGPSWQMLGRTSLMAAPGPPGPRHGSPVGSGCNEPSSGFREILCECWNFSLVVTGRRSSRPVRHRYLAQRFRCARCLRRIRRAGRYSAFLGYPSPPELRRLGALVVFMRNGGGP